MKILLVDDKAHHVNRLSSILRDRGEEVTIAVDGIEAFNKALSDPPDCIISDILLPRMDGLELCRKCRLEEGLDAVRFFFASSILDSAEEQAVANAAGADGILKNAWGTDLFIREFYASLDLLNSNPIERGFRPTPPELPEIQEYNTALVHKLISQLEKVKDAHQIDGDSQLQIAQVLVTMPVPLSVTDWDGNSVLENQQFNEMFGYTGEDISNTEEFLEVAFPDEGYRDEIRQEYFTRLKKAIAGAPFEPMEAEVTCRDGQIRFVEFKLVIVGDYLIGVYVDLTPHKRIEKAFRRLVETTSSQFGEEFFEAMSIELAEILGADYALIGKLEGEEPDWSVKTLALVAEGKPCSEFTYKLKGTPCENVIGQTTCIYRSGVADMFPEDLWLKDNSIQCYVGTPLFTSLGKPVGITVAMYTSPVEDTDFNELILQLFSARIGSEIERMDAGDELQARIDELQRWHEVTLGREERIHELKTEVNQLLVKLGKKEQYLN